MDFYQSMTTKQVRDPTLIHFTIDGRHGILGARHIARPCIYHTSQAILRITEYGLVPLSWKWFISCPESFHKSTSIEEGTSSEHVSH
ncbi:hypothetical protein CK203_044625 [Vitis vinifera]|uniref:Uncharacterized protein n=1 Tax=Vitis vinifera TaxID=29760 RepID=A0A438HJM3_VITVI|nr:hypothetical protein CK203_044625 [Vitis vinifera]